MPREIIRICLYCHQEFTAQRVSAMYCPPPLKCKMLAWAQRQIHPLNAGGVISNPNTTRIVGPEPDARIRFLNDRLEHSMFEQFGDRTQFPSDPYFAPRQQRTIPTVEYELFLWKIVAELNTAKATDTVFMAGLLDYKLPINDALKREFPFLQDAHEIGALGLLNLTLRGFNAGYIFYNEEDEEFAVVPPEEVRVMGGLGNYITSGHEVNLPAGPTDMADVSWPPAGQTRVGDYDVLDISLPNEEEYTGFVVLDEDGNDVTDEGQDVIIGP